MKKLIFIILTLCLIGIACEEKNPKDVYHKNIQFAEYSLAETSCQWTGFEPNTVIIINNNEDLENYIDCTEDSSPEIDFSKNTLLLAMGGATYGIDYIDTDFLQEAVNRYILNVNIHTDDTTVAPPWIISIIVPKIGNETIITLNVQQINN